MADQRYAHSMFSGAHNVLIIRPKRSKTIDLEDCTKVFQQTYSNTNFVLNIIYHLSYR